MRVPLKKFQSVICIWLNQTRSMTWFLLLPASSSLPCSCRRPAKLRRQISVPSWFGPSWASKPSVALRHKGSASGRTAAGRCWEPRLCCFDTFDTLLKGKMTQAPRDQQATQPGPCSILFVSHLMENGGVSQQDPTSTSLWAILFWRYARKASWSYVHEPDQPDLNMLPEYRMLFHAILLCKPPVSCPLTKDEYHPWTKIKPLLND